MNNQHPENRYWIAKIPIKSQTEYERLRFELISAIHQDNEIAFNSALQMLDQLQNESKVSQIPLDSSQNSQQQSSENMEHIDDEEDDGKEAMMNNSNNSSNNNNISNSKSKKSNGKKKWVWTPMMFAVHKNRSNFVKAFLDRGSDANERDPKKHSTLLHMACEHSYVGYKTIAQHLLTNKPMPANINACDKESQTPAFICCKHNNAPTLKLLLDYEIHGQICDINIPKLSNQHSCLYQACDKGYKEIVKLLLEYKHISVNVESVDNGKRFTPLMRAGMRNHTEIVQMLLAYGANINAVNTWGRNCLMISAKAHHSKVCKILLNNTESERKEMVELWATDNKDRNVFYFISAKFMDKRISEQIRKILYVTLSSVIHECCKDLPHGVIQAICDATY